MCYIDIRLNGKYYIQRTEYSKIIEFDEQNKKNNIYDDINELDEEVKKEIENIIKIKENPNLIFDYEKNSNDTASIYISGHNIKIKNLIIPEYINGLKVTKINKINNHKDIERLVIPNSVTEINPYFCYGFPLLEEVILSKNIKSLPIYAFYDCDKLSKINLENIENINYMCFYNCRRLNNLNLNSLKKIADHAFGFCSSITNLILPSIEIISDAVFLGNMKLKNLVFGPNLKKIGKLAFKHCNALNNIILPDGIKVLYDSTFKGCSCLKNIVFPSNLEEIKDGVFEGSGLAGNIVLPKSLVRIGKNVFINCDIDVINVYKDTKYSNESFGGINYKVYDNYYSYLDER